MDLPSSGKRRLAEAKVNMAFQFGRRVTVGTSLLGVQENPRVSETKVSTLSKPAAVEISNGKKPSGASIGRTAIQFSKRATVDISFRGKHVRTVLGITMFI